MSWQQALERTVTGLGYDLVDVERSAGGLLRVTIDRLPGRAYSTGAGEFVLVEDCEIVTRQLQYVFEVEAVDYDRLEVSSPGLDRPLKKLADWQRFVGAQVEVTLRVAFQGRKKWHGALLAPLVAPVGATRIAADDAAPVRDLADAERVQPGALWLAKMVPLTSPGATLESLASRTPNNNDNPATETTT